MKIHIFPSHAPLINNEKFLHPCKLMPNRIYSGFMIEHKELIMSLIFFSFMLKEGKKRALVD